ncbi:lipocalin family protein [Flagellimonas sp. HMM57]|uniref:lipocalin family protein n=1 Tax=unclassified Flagellimonas TaxID=2644544 RepID=UPI0013D5DF9C|nr:MULTISPECIES: lipocalin family protein [unclassified Flagellimonas]UII75841.1 lipocalin family protein [Flagellimonas sp. HMM57]
MKLKKCFYYVILVLAISCSKDNENDIDQGNIDNFYSGADSSASINQLEGVWAIVSAEFEGERTTVPINYPECGRDFFVYSDNGMYREYIFPGSDCRPEINRLNWTLDRGVLTLSNSVGQSDDLVIIRITAQEFVFKSRFDVDSDGELDVLILTANRYDANEFDLTTSTFDRNRDEDFEDVLSFTWEAYEGFNTFNRYEIYRSAGENCTKANAELIATIIDVSTVEYTDLNPPGEESLCYYLRVYTDKGLLGESTYIGVNPSFFIYINAISLDEPIVNGNSISLSWAPSDSPYFSHYEVTVSNYAGTSASAAQEYVLAEIDNINETSFTDETPPYLENPFYTVYAYNIFGNKSPISDSERTGVREVIFKRKEIIEFKRVISLDVDSEEPIVYLYGENSGNGITGVNILRFNYQTHEIETISDISPESQTYSGIKVFNSIQNGKELVVQQGIELHFYDANTLEFKYAIDPEGVFSFRDFTYVPELDLWIVIESNNIYTLKRDNRNLSLVDTDTHFTQHQGNSYHRGFMINDNRVLIGHPNEPNSIVKTLDDNGFIIGSTMVDFSIQARNGKRTLYNSVSGYLLNTGENRLYDTDTFQILQSFEFPSFPTGTSTDGNLILGTNNDPGWQIDADSPHKKEAVILNRATNQVDELSTIGYPHFIFEDYNGDIISISSGFKKESLEQNINGKADIFIEKIQLQ